MFILYDENMNKIPYPDGIVPLDIFVGSIAKERQTETIEGRNGVADYGFNYRDRPVDLSLWIKAYDTTDYRLLRNELYALFDTGSVFYVAEKNVPSRVLKVVIDDSYIPDRLTRHVGSVDITCRTLDSVFWESTYTTLELHNTGYSATAEKYGLVDNIDDEKVKYRFEGSPYNENLMSAPYDYSNPKGRNYETIHPGLPTGKYTISFDYEIHEVGRELTGFRLYAGEAIDIIPRTSKNADYTKLTFDITPEMANEPVYLYAGSAAGFSGENDATFKNIKIESGDQATPFDVPSTNFSVYNAGNVTIEPENMMLNIIVNAVKSDNNFTIRNKTTGEEIILKRASFGSHFRIQGMVFSFGSFTNIFRDTNRRFISLVPGDNEFEILNGTFEEIRFEFKYLYK